MLVRRLLALALLLLVAREARALPSGGLFGGAARANGASAGWNPAAVVELGESWAGLVELQGIGIGGAFSRDGLDPNTQAPYPRVEFIQLAPNFSFLLAAPTPVPWLRLVVGGFSPLALAVNWPDDGPNRYHATTSAIVTYGVPVGIAIAPSDAWGISAAIGPMYGYLDSTYHLDFGAFANGQLEPGAQPLPLENPQLEGRVQLHATGWDALAIAGVWARPVPSLRLGAGLVRPFGMTLEGTAVVHSSPALDRALPGFQIDSKGKLSVSYDMSFQVQAEVEWTPNEWSVAAVWQNQMSHVRAIVPAQIKDATVSFLNGDQTSVGDIRDELIYGLRVSRQVGGEWEFGVRFDWLPSSIPTEVMNPGNMDYDMAEFTVGARFRFGARSVLELAYMYAHAFDVHVRNSVYTPYAPPSSGLASPSGNGLYQVAAHMILVSIVGAKDASDAATR